MKVVLDVPEQALKKVQELVRSGRFSSVGVFLGAAIENQLALEDGPSRAIRVDFPSDAPRLREAISRGEARGSVPLLPVITPSENRPTASIPRSATLSVDETGWIWGLLNRLLPLKVAARVAAAASNDAPVSLSDLRKKASGAAVAIGRHLAVLDGDLGNGREERLSTGFPVRNPDKSVARFADHFVGRVATSGEVRGGLFDLGLAGSVVGASDQDRVTLTKSGWEFALLPNPVLDGGEAKRGLSKDEASVYVTNAIRSVPREQDCLRTVLATVCSAPTTGPRLDSVIRAHFGNRIGPAEATTLRAGAVGRFLDLGLLTQRRGPGGAVFEASTFGREQMKVVDGVS